MDEEWKDPNIINHNLNNNYGRSWFKEGRAIEGMIKGEAMPPLRAKSTLFMMKPPH